MPPIMPAGMPPGAAYPSEDRAPDAVLYFRIYAGSFLACYAMVTLFGVGLTLAPIVTGATKAPPLGPDVGFYVGGVLYGGLGLAHLVPANLALFGGRRPWVHTMGTVVIALGMFSVCCIPVLIPLLIVWMKPDTRAWYGVT
jgi:hypothetical protein